MSSPKELQEESEDFISTLPCHKIGKVHLMYNYEGFWYDPRSLLGVISSQKHFEAQDSDVFVITNPKCGTTWMKAITFTLLNRKRHHITSHDHPLLTRNPHDLVPFIDIDLCKDGKIPDVQPFPSPRLFATHVPYTTLPESIRGNSKCKVVYMSRNPKDTLVSLWHFLANVGRLDPTTVSIEAAFEYFCKGMSFYGPFWEHVLEYWKQSVENSDKVLFLRYEDMKEEPQLQLRRLAKFLNCPFTAEEEEGGVVDQVMELTSFRNLSSLEVNKNGKTTRGEDNHTLFRRGEVGDWKNYLTAEMADKIDEISRLKFYGSGLDL